MKLCKDCLNQCAKELDSMDVAVLYSLNGNTTFANGLTRREIYELVGTMKATQINEIIHKLEFVFKDGQTKTYILKHNGRVRRLWDDKGNEIVLTARFKKDSLWLNNFVLYQLDTQAVLNKLEQIKDVMNG